MKNFSLIPTIAAVSLTATCTTAFLNPVALTTHTSAAAQRVKMSTVVEDATRQQTRSSSALNEKKIGLDFLPPETVERAKEGHKFEKVKLAKCGSAMFDEVHEFSAAIRSGKYTWEELDIDDSDIRLKWAGLFHRRKKDPGTFMVRMKIPNGIVNTEQMRFMADCAAKYDKRIGVLDITTRQAIQIRGVPLEDASDVVNGAYDVGMTTLMTGMDNVRNLVGSPIAGIDPHEMYDTRALCTQISDWLTDNRKGNPEWANLPRKFNIAISGSRDDFAHTMINDLGLQPAVNAATGEMGFNVVVGGFFSIQRAAMSLDLDLWIPESEAFNLAKSVMRIFRDEGPRVARAKSRLMYLLDDWGVDKFRAALVADMKANHSPNFEPLRAMAQPGPQWEKRDIVGIHAQKQPDLSWVCVNIPVGRMTPADAHMAADVAAKYSNGEIRFTVDENLIFPNVRNEDLQIMQEEMPFFQRFPVEQGALISKMVSCTGSEFCGFGLVETKNRAIAVAAELEKELDFPNGAPRIHWTGCPNSCGQAQVGDIGLMGGPARVDKKAVEGVNIFLGGTVGEGGHHLGEIAQKGIPAAMEYLKPALMDVCIEKFGAVRKNASA